MKKKILVILFFVILALIALTVFIIVKEGAGRKTGVPREQGSIHVPKQRSFIFQDSSALQQETIKYWTTIQPTEWVDGEKVNLKNPRTVLGCLKAGVRVEEMNEYLMRQKATGVAGSRWLLNPRGGYNFNTMALTPVLFLFDDRPDLLYPETKAHLVKNILTVDGDEFTRNVPKLPMQDSENHILMAESSRYLKNQWLRNHGNLSPEYNNATNGVGKGLKSFLEEIYTYGIWEFNSAPYLGYTYCSLLNLHEFGTGEIKLLAEKILDRINWQYALSSYQFKHFPPYRRRFGEAFKTNLDSDYHTVMLKVWASLYDTTRDIGVLRGQHHALWASIMSYRPPDKVMEWTLEKPHEYFVKMGHGYNSCPEIYSGDLHYLLSSGGANQGRRSLIMPKPIVLFLDDDASDLQETFHMYGPGEELMNWNNTGVYKDFACTKGKVLFPKGRQALRSSGEWKIFFISDGIFLITYSENELGILTIARADSAEKALNKIIKENSDVTKLKFQFNHPNGNFIEFDLDSPKNKWVITKVNKKAVDRDFEQWPFFEGVI